MHQRSVVASSASAASGRASPDRAQKTVQEIKPPAPTPRPPAPRNLRGSPPIPSLSDVRRSCGETHLYECAPSLSFRSANPSFLGCRCTPLRPGSKFVLSRVDPPFEIVKAGAGGASHYWKQPPLAPSFFSPNHRTFSTLQADTGRSRDETVAASQHGAPAERRQRQRQWRFVASLALNSDASP